MNLLTLPYLCELVALPAFPVVRGPSAPTCESPAYWPAGLAQLPGVWHDGGRSSSLPVFGPQHAVHFDKQDHEESPVDERGHQKWHMQLNLNLKST